MPKRRTKKSIPSNSDIIVIPKKNMFMKYNSRYGTSWGNPGNKGQASGLSLAFPPQRFMTMQYYETYTITQDGGTSAPQQWRLNSLHDVDYTGVLTGHRPYYYNEITGQYANYKVYGVRVDYEYTCNNGSGSPLDSMIVFRPTADGTTPTASPTGFQVEVERPNSVMKTYSSGGNPVRGVLKLSPRKILGYTKGQYDDDDRTGAAGGSNPLVSPYLNCIPLSTAATSTHVLRVKISLFCKWYTRKVVAGS